MRQIYLSGPMSGIEDNNRPAFFAAEGILQTFQWVVLNPARWSDEGPYATLLRRDLEAVLRVDAIAVLPGWENSRGATLEVAVAVTIGLPILATWCADCIGGHHTTHDLPANPRGWKPATGVPGGEI